MKLTTCKMPPELIDRLEAESQRTGAPKSVITRRALEAYLSKQETTEVWIGSDLILDDALHALPSDEFMRKFRAACEYGEHNEFSPYVRILPFGQGPPKE